MITLASPSMTLNDDRSPRSYAMDYTRNIAATTAMDTLVNYIQEAANKATGRRLSNLILNGHGAPGYLEIGTGLSEATMGPFSRIRGRVSKIWITGCLVARIGDGPCGAFPGADGHVFLSRFARLTGCYVVAATELQGSAEASYPTGSMDTFEGLVVSYAPSGRLSWQRRNPSVYDYDETTRTAGLPNRE